MTNTGQHFSGCHERWRIPGRPPNAGAHRLAVWVLRDDAGAKRRRQTLRTFASHALIEAMLAGRVVPFEDLAELIATTTGGAVRPDDWDRAATGTWGDAPTPHEELH